MRKLAAEVEAVVREGSARASPYENIPVDENASRAPSGELSRYDCQQVGSTAETISEKQDVGITARRYRERAEVVDADGDAGSFWQGHRDGGPPDRLPRFFPCFDTPSSCVTTTGCRCSYH